MAFAIPSEAKTRLVRIGSAFATGAAAAGAQKIHPAAGTIVVFGGGILGLLSALTMKGVIADIGEGMANAAAASVGNIAVGQVLKAGVGHRTERLVASGGPRVSLLAAGPSHVESLIPRDETVRSGGYRSL